MATPTKGFEFAYSHDGSQPWVRTDVPTTASVTYRKGDLVLLVAGAASLGTAAIDDTTPIIGICAEAATVTSSTVPGTVAVMIPTPAHVFRVQYTGTPNAAAIMGGTIDLENCATVDASDVTAGKLALDRNLDTTNAWAYVRFKSAWSY